MAFFFGSAWMDWIFRSMEWTCIIYREKTSIFTLIWQLKCELCKQKFGWLFFISGWQINSNLSSRNAKSESGYGLRMTSQNGTELLGCFQSVARTGNSRKGNVECRIMNGVKPIKIDKFIGTAIESVWMLYIAIGSNWKFLLSAKIVKNVKYYIGLICWCATFVVVQQNLLMCILNREISCVQRDQERQAAWASILVLLWKLEILREKPFYKWYLS